MRNTGDNRGEKTQRKGGRGAKKKRKKEEGRAEERNNLG